MRTNHFFLFQNLKTQGFLVLDTEDRNLNYPTAFAVTTNPHMNFSCPRSLFSFGKYTKSDTDLIRYGEKLVMITHDEIYSERLYLFSTLISPQSYSRFSRNQEVLVNSCKGYSTCWIIEHADPKIRFSMEGNVVLKDDPFILRHCATGRLLGSDLIDYNNDYGREYEVCCGNFMSSNKYQTLISEKVGKMKIDTEIQVELDQNIWRVVDRLD